MGTCDQFRFYLYLFYFMSVLPLHMSVHLIHIWSEEKVASLGTGVMGGCESPCGCWELNLGPLQDEQVLLTTQPPLPDSQLIFDKGARAT